MFFSICINTWTKMSKKDTKFIAEDNLIYALLLFFKTPKKKISKADNVNKVDKALDAQKDDFSQTIVGVIDDDKKTHQIPYISSFEEVKQKDDLTLKQSKDNPNQKVILLKPASEKWVLESAKSVGVKTEDFKLPDNAKELGKITKTAGIENDQNFNQFLQAIEKKKASRFETFKEWIKEFLEN